MSGRYHIQTQLAEEKFPVVGRFTITRSDECCNCGICTEACIYEVHHRQEIDIRRLSEPGPSLCKNCFRCLQECPKDALSMSLNPAYRTMGRNYWTADLVASLWQQADNGRIPVLGAGYRGPFTGSGFDGMWTDMSEIVRPTRDGIHGREFISTSLDLGRTPMFLRFDGQGQLVGTASGQGAVLQPREIPIPVLFQVLPEMLLTTESKRAIMEAAAELGTLVILPVEYVRGKPAFQNEHVIVSVRDGVRRPASGVRDWKNEVAAVEPFMRNVAGVEIDVETVDGGRQATEEINALARGVREINPKALIGVCLPLGEGLETFLQDLLQQGSFEGPSAGRRTPDAGIDFLHLWADSEGCEPSGDKRFLIEPLRAAHRYLVENLHRDGVTVLISGGIASAEHVPKAIICGADAVAVDYPLLVALGCRLCDTCPPELGGCPLERNVTDIPWGVQRIVNLMGAWRDQFLEVLGAMGMREVRRLRGDVGRAMFFEELEREVFEPLFRRPASGVRRPEEEESYGQRDPHLPRSGGLAEGDEASGGDLLNNQAEGQKDLTPDAGRRSPEAASWTPPAIKPVTNPFGRPLSKFQVIRTDDCMACGLCEALCPFGVHHRPDGYIHTLPPEDEKCIGFKCKENDFYCIDKCPTNALQMRLNPDFEALGDPRWTSDLIVATWEMAEAGQTPRMDLEWRVGASGGGFDRMRFREEPGVRRPASGVRESDSKSGLLMGLLHQSSATDPTAGRRSPDAVSTAIDLNRRHFGPRLRIPIPWYGGGMSFGSVGLSTMIARAKAAKAWNTFVSTGEGGYPPALYPWDDCIITQVATGLFGVSEDTIQRVRIVEMKYAQGAKPGLGGHLLADKNTPDVAHLRETVPGISLFSPFPFHSVYSVEDHKKHLDWIRSINPDALISVKVSTPTDVDMVAVGSYYAGANIIHLDGGYGGTGAAPEIAKKNIAMPIEYAIPKVHRFLQEEGIRNEVVLIASGGLRTSYDIAKAIALGADGVVIGTADLVAIECVRCGNCESGRGCPRGIATTDPELVVLIEADWGAQRLINLYHAWRQQLIELLQALDLPSIKALRGRTDLLEHMDYLSEPRKNA